METNKIFKLLKGDRLDVENIVVLVTDGYSEDKIQLPVTVKNKNILICYLNKNQTL